MLLLHCSDRWLTGFAHLLLVLLASGRCVPGSRAQVERPLRGHGQSAGRHRHAAQRARAHAHPQRAHATVSLLEFPTQSCSNLFLFCRMKDMGYGAGYKYNPDYEGLGPVDQTYLPDVLQGRTVRSSCPAAPFGP